MITTTCHLTQSSHKNSTDDPFLRNLPCRSVRGGWEGCVGEEGVQESDNGCDEMLEIQSVPPYKLPSTESRHAAVVHADSRAAFSG
ncbi:hypothetical protein CDAR_58621 [Caerostris darwini]|uniref:Uncharacterized protein n=1 Tax=Caerostris darwini TaxID=1538125 RepID=A0AAV4T719_9ARAC|nr:hypothetical protein CDAR_58621 [Caerostris darwini]